MRHRPVGAETFADALRSTPDGEAYGAGGDDALTELADAAPVGGSPPA